MASCLRKLLEESDTPYTLDIIKIAISHLKSGFLVREHSEEIHLHLPLLISLERLNDHPRAICQM